MARPVKRCPTPLLPEGTGEPETNVSAGGTTRCNRGQSHSRLNLDIDYEGSKPANEPVAQEHEEENFDAEYANMEIPQAGTHCRQAVDNLHT